MSKNEGEIVQVPVPREYLDVVYRALAGAMGRSVETQVRETPTPPSEVGGVTQYEDKKWQQVDIQRLKQRIKTATPVAMLDLTTSRLHERIPLTEVREHAGRTHEEARADLAGFTQLVRRGFGRDNWPVKVMWGDNGLAHYYCDDEDVARWWNSAKD